VNISEHSRLFGSELTVPVFQTTRSTPVIDKNSVTTEAGGNVWALAVFPVWTGRGKFENKWGPWCETHCWS